MDVAQESSFADPEHVEEYRQLAYQELSHECMDALGRANKSRLLFTVDGERAFFVPGTFTETRVAIHKHDAETIIRINYSGPQPTDVEGLSLLGMDYRLKEREAGLQLSASRYVKISKQGEEAIANWRAAGFKVDLFPPRRTTIEEDWLGAEETRDLIKLVKGLEPRDPTAN